MGLRCKYTASVIRPSACAHPLPLEVMGSREKIKWDRNTVKSRDFYPTGAAITSCVNKHESSPRIRLFITRFILTLPFFLLTGHIVYVLRDSHTNDIHSSDPSTLILPHLGITFLFFSLILWKYLSYNYISFLLKIQIYTHYEIYL